MDAQVRSYVLKKYGYPDELSDEALRKAMEESSQSQLMTSLGRAGSTIGAAISGTKPDQSFYDDMNQVAKSKVSDLMTMRRSKADEIGFSNAQMKQEKEQALLDPSSSNSAAFRKIIETNFPSISKAYGDHWGSISAADKDLLFQPIQLKEQLDARKQSNSIGLLDRQIGLMDKLNKNKDIERLPVENQEVIKDLAKKSATKLSIANQIDAVVKTLEDPNVSEEQKITQGRQLLKTLNSTEGADAIGKEEADRLGSFLNFHYMNLTQPGPVFGRDLGAFTEQAKLTSGAVKNAIQSNKSNISKLYQESGVPRADPINPPANEWEAKKLKAIEWIKKNPADPRAKEIAKRLKIDV
jgi:hypothetical protein